MPNPMEDLTLNRPIQDQKDRRPIALVSDLNMKQKTTHQAFGVSLGLGIYLIFVEEWCLFFSTNIPRNSDGVHDF